MGSLIPLHLWSKTCAAGALLGQIWIIHPKGLSLGKAGRLSGCPLGSHAWILIAMFHLAMDLASCQPPATGTGGRLSPRPALRHRLSRGSPAPAGRPRRPADRWSPPAPAALPEGSAAPARPGFGSRDGRPTEDSLESSTLPGAFATTTTTTTATTTATTAPPPRHRCHAAPSAPSTPAPAAGGDVPRSSPGRTSTAEPAAGHSSGGKDARPPRGLGDSTGLAVHQIITITVSLIMVIAALITTLVLKNCCAQSGRPRRNSHQRKLDQQEESCQNLTDFAPARVPSALDIFTAYNETLQCSHECVRTPVPVYAEDTLHSPGDYKTTFNGNRPSSSDRHLIPVAFVSEKWFEISC
uniref:Adherens junctions associated protein 1 n=1 Tax=Malurus cyaneus samueli TaxID=2593467 RepID=A0A8C5U9L0_9PASS